MKRKKLKMGLKNKFKKTIRKLKRIFILLMISFVIYNVVSYVITGQFKTEQAQDNETVVETQKVVKTTENGEINVDIIKTNVKNIPVCSNSQTKTYMDYKMITNKSSKQWQYINASGKIKIENGYLMEGEYIGVALGSYFGEIGTKYIFTLDTGKQIKVVKIEEKADAHYTPEEWAKMYDNGDGDSYWTEWEEETGMNEYTICVTETLQRCITIKADTEEQAIDKVQEMYDNEEIVLDSSDFIETNIAKLEN